MKDITLVTAIAFILFMSSGVTGPVSSLYAESLGASYVAIGLLGTVTSLSAILFSYAWGRASDHLGQRKVFLVSGLATLSLSSGLMSIVPSYEWLFPLRTVSAIAQAAYGTASLALMGDLLERHPDERGRRMGTFRGLASLGFGLMAFLSGRLADWLSIRAPFGLAALLLLLAFAIALKVREPSPEPGSASLAFTFRIDIARIRSLIAGALERSRMAVGWLVAATVRKRKDAAVPQEGVERLPLAPLLISAFLWSLVTGAVYAVWANYMVAELDYSRATMSALWSLASTSEFPLMILAGWLSDRFGRLPMLSLGFLAWTLVFVGYVIVPAMPWIVLVQLVRGFAYSAYTATAMTYAAEVRSKEQRGRASGLYSSSGGLGSILGSSLGGTLAQLAGIRTMIATNAVLIFCGAVYLAVVAMQPARRVRAPLSGEPSR